MLDDRDAARGGRVARAGEVVAADGPWLADRRIEEARATDVEALRRALEALAELELASRGNTELSEETAALQAIDAIGAGAGEAAA